MKKASGLAEKAVPCNLENGSCNIKIDEPSKYILEEKPVLSVVTTTDPIGKKLPKLLVALSTLAKEMDTVIRVVVVDDLGQWRLSPPPAKSDYPFLDLLLINSERHQGQMASVVNGIARCDTPLVLTLDPDMYACVPEIPRMLSMIDRETWIVHGCRTTRPDISMIRWIGSHCINLLVRMITGLKIKDIGSPITLAHSQALSFLSYDPVALGNPRLYLYIGLNRHVACYNLLGGTEPGVPSQYSFWNLLRLGIRLVRDSIKYTLKVR